MANDSPLTIERRDGAAPGTTIMILSGPVTLRNLFDLQPQLRAGELPKVFILDLSGVPYMDSAGMGAIINHFVHCQNQGVKFVASGVSPRVRELFIMTKVDAIIPQVDSIEAADSL